MTAQTEPDKGITPDQLRSNAIVTGTIFPEAVQVITATPMGSSVKLFGKGLRSNQVYDYFLGAEQLAQLQLSPETESYDGDPLKFRLGVEALRWGLAHEYDPYFSLAIACVDTLPHQLEAVYDYFLKLPRIRFLLADDPRAGKTIMTGLLLKEFKIRGLAKRTLIVAPANLTFQWQREMKVDTPVALMRGILGSSSFLNLTGRIQPNQRESPPPLALGLFHFLKF